MEDDFEDTLEGAPREFSFNGQVSDKRLEIFSRTRVHPFRDVKAVFVSARAGCSIEDMFDNRWFDFWDFPYLAFFNGSAFVRFAKRDAAFFAGLQFVRNGLRDFVWQGQDTGFALMSFLTARLSAGRAARGCASSFPGVIRGWRFV